MLTITQLNQLNQLHWSIEKLQQNNKIKQVDKYFLKRFPDMDPNDLDYRDLNDTDFKPVLDIFTTRLKQLKK